MTRDEILRLLPAVVARTAAPGTITDGLVAVMAELMRPDDAILDRFDAVLDPRRAPERFVPFLARWVDLARLLPTSGNRAAVADLARMRELIAHAHDLARWRGTRTGLLRFLALATGADGFAVNERVDAAGRPREHHICVRHPPGCAGQRPLMEAVIELAKPAHITYELVAAA
jgi:phage tail-like protein